MADLPMTENLFSLARYGALIAAFHQAGYAVVGFAEVQATARHLVLRHDIDFDLEAAAKMAEFEADEGIHATYFVMLRTEFYNVFSKTAETALARIRASGHDIGLHFDAALYQGDGQELIQAARAECRVLGQAVQSEINVLSFHRPHPDLLGSDIEFDGIINAYHRRYFEDIGYCSDSRGAWHYGQPLDHAAVAAGGALQLLTHPIWWMGREGADAQETVARFLAGRQAELAQEASIHCAAYRPILESKS